jgi:hypothetical protein
MNTAEVEHDEALANFGVSDLSREDVIPFVVTVVHNHHSSIVGAAMMQIRKPLNIV